MPQRSPTNAHNDCAAVTPETNESLFPSPPANGSNRSRSRDEAQLNNHSQLPPATRRRCSTILQHPITVTLHFLQFLGQRRGSHYITTTDAVETKEELLIKVKEAIQNVSNNDRMFKDIQQLAQLSDAALEERLEPRGARNRILQWTTSGLHPILYIYCHGRIDADRFRALSIDNSDEGQTDRSNAPNNESLNDLIQQLQQRHNRFEAPTASWAAWASAIFDGGASMHYPPQYLIRHFTVQESESTQTRHASNIERHVLSNIANMLPAIKALDEEHQAFSSEFAQAADRFNNLAARSRSIHRTLQVLSRTMETHIERARLQDAFQQEQERREDILNGPHSTQLRTRIQPQYDVDHADAT